MKLEMRLMRVSRFSSGDEDSIGSDEEDGIVGLHGRSDYIPPPLVLLSAFQLL